MTTIETAIRYMEISDKKLKEINNALQLTTYEPARRVMEEQINALLWVNELVMREVRNEQNVRDIQEKEEE